MFSYLLKSSCTPAVSAFLTLGITYSKIGPNISFSVGAVRSRGMNSLIGGLVSPLVGRSVCLGERKEKIKELKSYQS